MARMFDSPDKKARGRAYGAVGGSGAAYVPIQLPPGFPFANILNPSIRTSVDAEAGREARNRAIVAQLAAAGINADVIGSHMDQFDENVSTETLSEMPVVYRRGDVEAYGRESPVAQAIRAIAMQPNAPENVVLAACRHRGYSPEECRALQSVADTSRGGRGLNIIAPLGRNTAQDNNNPLGRISATNEQYYDTEGNPIKMKRPPKPGGAIKFSKGQAPRDTTLSDPEQSATYLSLIKALMD